MKGNYADLFIGKFSSILLVMFPTTGKSKIPRTLAYAVNATMISEALANAPQAKEISIDFLFHSSFASYLKTQVFPVFSIFYYRREVNQFTSHNVEEIYRNQSQWRITIKPVPIQIKHHVQELLQLEGFSKAQDWLRNNSCPTGTQKALSLRISYNQDFDRLEYQGHLHS